MNVMKKYFAEKEVDIYGKRRLKNKWKRKV